MYRYDILKKEQKNMVFVIFLSNTGKIGGNKTF